MPKIPIILTKTIFFSDDDQEKQQIVRQNALEMWKAKTACLLSVLLKCRLRRVLSNNHRPVGTFIIISLNMTTNILRVSYC